ncbi:FAD-linked oxidoreductase-like protein [Rhypophila sp. PSN 637]
MAPTEAEIEKFHAYGLPVTDEEWAKAKQNARLSIPAFIRIPMASGSAFLVGLLLGTAQGSRMAGLRFRAEHAHKLPNTTTGWYLYHKSKNYHVAYGGLREGLKMGTKVCFWTTAVFGIENMFDSYRGASDLFNTVTACVTVAGGFSLWNRFSLPMAARTTRTALVIGFVYGGLQDLAGAVRGRPIGLFQDHHQGDATTTNSMAKYPVAPLSVLPLTNILRSLMTTTVSSSPILLPPSLTVMSLLAHTNNPLLNPDRNPLLRYALKKTFYAQFCAGENATEVKQTVAELKTIGFSGVILGYAKEVVMTNKDQAAASLEPNSTPSEESTIQNEIEPWAKGTIETVKLASKGDFVALKFTGAGQQALSSLMKQLPPSEALGNAIDKICQLAAERGVRLLFDAEQQAVQAGIDDWTLKYMRKYNRGTSPSNRSNRPAAVIYGTYQAYLKATPRILSSHLATAQKEGFTLGVKLVRGAYLGSDPRHLIHDTKADTDGAYDGIAEGLLTRQWNAPLKAPEGEDFPSRVDVVLASHNRESVLKARGILQQQTAMIATKGGEAIDVAFAQLQGMADEVSCELVVGSEANQQIMAAAKPNVYKYLVWGSTGECMKYLLRRAQENRDAVQRTRSGREAMRAELVRRVKAWFGLSS